MPHNPNKAKKSRLSMRVNLNQTERYSTRVKSKSISELDKSLKVGILVSWP